MTEDNFCDQIENAMKELLNEGKTVVKASDIAEKTDIEAGDFQSPSQRIGWSLGFGACGNLNKVGWEILDESGSNEYRLWYR